MLGSGFITGYRGYNYPGWIFRYDSTKKWEVPYPTLINSDYAIFEIEDSFIARAVNMNLGDMHLEASRFEFSGMKLANSYNKDGRSKGGLFSPTKHYSSIAY